MSTRDHLIKILTHLQDHNTKKLLTHNLTNAITHDACALIHYLHSQLITDMTTMEFLLPPRNTGTPLFQSYQKRTSQTALSALFFQDVMVQLTVSHSILPTSSSLKLTIFHHTLRTQNISSTLLKIFHHSQPRHSWSQLMSRPYTHTFNMMMAYQLLLILWRNKSISYPQTAYLLIQFFMQSSISFLNIVPSVSWTHTSTKSSGPPWEQGWLSPMPNF